MSRGGKRRAGGEAGALGTAAAFDEVSIVHRDADLLVLYKPPGLVTTRPDVGPSLSHRAHQLDRDAERLHPSSRLDAEVSGLVTFARTRRATEALLSARRRGEYGRLYLGLCARAPEPRQGRWDAPIGLDLADKRRRVAVVAAPGGAHKARGQRQAATRYETRACVEHACLLALWPETGRTHQLRVHAASAGVALLGDRVYGGSARITLSDGRVLRAGRVMLHCAALSLPAIGKGEPLQLRAAVPQDMLQLWQALGGSVGDFEGMSPSG